MSQEQIVEAFEGTFAQIQAQADKAFFDYRTECGRRGDGQWAERLPFKPSRRSSRRLAAKRLPRGAVVRKRGSSGLRIPASALPEARRACRVAAATSSSVTTAAASTTRAGP